MTSDEWAGLQVGQAVRNLGASYRVEERIPGLTKLTTVRQERNWSFWREDSDDHRKWHRWPQDDADDTQVVRY